MKRIALTLIVAFSALNNVACTKKKSASQQEMIHACLWDQSGNCQRQVAAYAQSPAILPIANQYLAQNPGLLAGTGTSMPVVLPPGGAVGVKTASVSDAALKAQSAKVAAAIQADSMNPSSLHYDPPQASRSPASIAPSSASSAAAAVPSSTENTAWTLPSGYGGSGGSR